MADTLKDTVSSKIDEAGGAGGLAKEAASGLLPSFGGGDDDGGGKGGVAGVGKGRRMPVQQSVDVAVPIETAYNQWTQFEYWPTFMHRVDERREEERLHGQLLDEDLDASGSSRPRSSPSARRRVKWNVSPGITHTGVVTFHELAPRLTRIELSLDVDPGSLIEKAARGMRHVKRAARADLHRFKAFIEMAEQETGAWRGVIEDGELVEEHDPSYDEEREYSDIEDFVEEDESEDRRRGVRRGETTAAIASAPSASRRRPSAPGAARAASREESSDEESGPARASARGRARPAAAPAAAGKAKPQGRRRSTSSS